MNLEASASNAMYLVNISEIFGGERAEPMRAYSYKGLREKYENLGACGAGGHVEETFFAKVDGGAFRISFEVLGVAVLGKLMDGPYKLGGG